MNEINITIHTVPRTKKNSQRIAKCGNFYKLLPSKAFEEYQRECGYYLNGYKNMNIIAPCEVKCLFYMPTRRRVDLCNLLNAIDDVLVYYHVLKDDNYKVIVSHDGSRVLYDKDTPRVEITIRGVGGVNE